MSRSFVPLWLAIALTLFALVTRDRNEESVQDEWRLHIPVEPKLRAEVLESLSDEFEVPTETRWTIMDGCPRLPVYPAAMASAGKKLFVATEKRLEVFDLESKSWNAEPIELKEPVGSGLVLVGKGEDKLFLVSGGERDSIWEITPSSASLRALPGLGQPIGIGAALTEWNDELYLAPGKTSTEFWVLRKDAESWISLGRIGGESTLDTAFGRNSGFLTTRDDLIFGWPNHHIHRFDTARQDWSHGPEVGHEMHDGNWVAMNFVPLFDGGGVASAPGVSSIYAMAGFFSRSLNEIIPEQKLAFFLRPRLPYPIIGEGDRMTIVRLDDVPYLVVYAVDPENKLCSIPLSQLERIRRRDDVADVGSKWHRFHTDGGGNGVRHWTTRVWKGPPEPMNKADRKGGTLGVMGALDGQLFTMRRAFTRRIDADSGAFSFYPGISLGRYLGLGAAGVFDGQEHVYFITGRSDYFIRRKIPKYAPPGKAPKHYKHWDETDLEVLPALPEEVGRCASMAHLDGALYTLRGGATREFWRFDLARQVWEVLPSLPEEALAIGAQGAGLIPGAGCVFAASGDQVWRYDVAAKNWTRFATLGFGVSWDGGMVAGDEGRHMYVARGGYSTRLGRLDLKSGAFEELYPRTPDAVSAEGNRMAVITVKGERRLYLHRGHNSNEILWIRLADLSTK